MTKKARKREFLEQMNEARRRTCRWRCRCRCRCRSWHNTTRRPRQADQHRDRDHAAHFECIAKGKVRTRYELGVKASVAVTAKERVVVGMRSMPGLPYDGHTIDSPLEKVEVLCGLMPTIALVDRGYRDVEAASGTRLRTSHTRRLAKKLKKCMRPAVAP